MKGAIQLQPTFDLPFLFLIMSRWVCHRFPGTQDLDVWLQMGFSYGAALPKVFPQKDTRIKGMQ